VSREITHRLFFALDPDDGVRRAVSRVQQDLDLDARRVPPANFHVTLAFLGMQRSEAISQVREVAAQLTFPSCRVTLDRVGWFRRAGVLWLGATHIPDPLRAFQRDLVGALLDAGIGYDRKPWELHLTLYRKLRKASPIMPAVDIEWTLEGFDLFESVSVKRGVEYHSIGHWRGGDDGKNSGAV
jgi:2'-5' RNA ligase